MTIRTTSATGLQNSTRQLACVQCGSRFECALDGTCWCAHEPVRLAVPVTGDDCLCPRCLREAARLQVDAKPQAGK